MNNMTQTPLTLELAPLAFMRGCKDTRTYTRSQHTHTHTPFQIFVHRVCNAEPHPNRLQEETRIYALLSHLEGDHIRPLVWQAKAEKFRSTYNEIINLAD